MRRRLDSVRAMQWFQVFRQGGLILAAVAMANGLLTTSEIGNFELLLFVGFSLSFFWVDGLLKTYLMEYELSRDKPRLNFHVYLAMLLISAVVLALFVVTGNNVLPSILGQDELQYYHLYGVYLFLLLPTNLISVHFLLREKYRQIYLAGIFMLAGPVLVVLLSMGVVGEIAWMYRGFVIYAGMLHFVLLLALLPNVRVRFNYPVFKTLFVLSWPLMIYAVAMSMARVFDGWLVSWYFSDESTFAVFRYGAREFPLAVALSTGITTAFVPLLQQDLASGLRNLKKRTSRLMDLLFPAGVILTLLSPWLFRMVFTETFTASAFIFNVYLLLIISQCLFPHAVLLSMKKNKVILQASLVELAVNILLSFILITFWELEGVALATAVAYVVEKVFYMIYLERKHGIKTSRYIPWRKFVLYCILLVTCFFVARFYIWM